MPKGSFQPTSLQIPDRLLHETLAHLRACLPAEGVALWSGNGQQVTSCYPLPNASSTPTIHYYVTPQDWLDALRRTTERGETPVALVHSHPTALARPSRRDVMEWYYPGLKCVIVSFATDKPEWAVYQMK